MFFFKSALIQKLNLSHKIILGLATLLFILSLTFFIQIKLNNTTRGMRPVVKIFDVQNIVEMQKFGSFVFSEVRNGQELNAGDKIFVGKKSSAKIVFINSKNEVVLSENSLIKIDDDEAGDRLKLEKGDIAFYSKEKKSVLVGNIHGDIELKNGELGQEVIRASAGKSGKILVQATGPNTGKVKSKSEPNSNSQAHELFKSQLEIVEPLKDQILPVGNYLKVEWKSREVIQLKVSTSLSMEPKIFEHTDQKKLGKWLSPKVMENGDYYLSLTEVSTGVSKILPFKVRNAEYTELVYPKPDDVIKISRNNASTSLSWRENSFKNYRLKMTINGVKQEPIDLKENKYSLNEIKENTQIQWSVSTINESLRELYTTEPRSVKIIFEGKNFLIKDTFKASYSKGEKVIFKWDSLDGEIFDIEIKNNSQAKVIFNESVKGNQFSFEAQEVGDYQFTLSSKSYPTFKALKHQFSIYQKVAISQNQLESYYGRNSIGKILRLKYQKLFPEPLILEVSSNSSFEPIIESYPIVDNELDFKLSKAGPVCLRVSARQSKGFYSPSDAECFIIDETDLINVPKAADLKIERRWFGFLKPAIVILPKVENAVFYEVKFYLDKKMKNEIYSEVVDKPELIFFNDEKNIQNYRRTDMKYGEFYFNYRIKNKYGQYSQYSNLSTMTLPISIPIIFLVLGLIVALIVMIAKKYFNQE